ncbi:MAG TPA: FAD:protein FMN transferase [Streptosporangiaceae bacterium]|nr:FAD:protein FMN transferase [Streptosporangiaceae bacterium]
MASFRVFGTTAVLLVTAPAMEGKAREIADVELAAVDLACSRFRSDSELSRINASRGVITRVSELFTELITEALRAAELTDGAVDPTVGQALLAAGYDRDFDELKSSAPVNRQEISPIPGWRNVQLDPVTRHVRLDHGAQLDLGSTAKAWSADRCATKIAAELDVGVLVSLGGDIAVAGPTPREGWNIRVTDDHAAPADAPGQTVTIRSGGLATSSTTVRSWLAGQRQMHHLIDPATGAPAHSPWRTVSVAAATCADANIASTASIIKGDSAVDWLATLGLPARLVAHDGTVTLTGDWPTDTQLGA